MHPARTYIVIKGLFGLGIGFTVTIYVPFLLSRGLNYNDVALINIFFWAIIVFAEVPTGMLADGRSRAWAIRTGQLLWAIGTLAYSFAGGVTSATIAEVILGMANAFNSGADNAWITDALKKRDEEDSIKRVMATSSIACTVGMLAGGVIAAPLGVIDLRIGWWLACACNLAAYIVARRYMGDNGEPIHRLNEWEALRQSWATLQGSPPLRWVLSASMLFAFVLPFNLYWSPFMEARVGQAGLSYIWLAVYLPLVAGNWCVRRSSSHQGHEQRSIVYAVALTGLGLAAATWPAGVALPALFFALHEFGRGLTEPLTTVFMQKHVDSGYRATYGSLQSLLAKIGCAAVLLLVWLYTRDQPSDEHTIRVVWTASGLAMLVGAGLLTLRLKR
ncbi:MAG: MFS transporter [Parcubacteria group bacterium]|nr:MFS transporter [Parcubacteria group bacterium]